MLKTLLALLLIGSFYLAWERNIFIRERQACAEPILYSIGTFDRRFDISRQDFLEAISLAEAIWEQPFRDERLSTNRELFAYDTNNSDLTINLVYDYRQEVTEELSEIESEVEETEALYRSLQSQYAGLKAKYLELDSLYRREVANYNSLRSLYEQAVLEWNAGSRTSPHAYRALEAQRVALESELMKVRQTEAKLDASIRELNTQAARLNRLARTLNLTVEEYNTIGASRGETFAGGIYSSGHDGEKIDVYEFRSREKLVRILAHELGHALGLEHVNDPNAIMYELNEGDKDRLTETDLEALRALCKNP